jgi:hypothetical protein
LAIQPVNLLFQFDKTFTKLFKCIKLVRHINTSTKNSATQKGDNCPRVHTGDDPIVLQIAKGWFIRHFDHPDQKRDRCGIRGDDPQRSEFSREGNGHKALAQTKPLV